MKVKNMISAKGNTVANQFIIVDDNATYFQSYNTIIAKNESGKITLDNDWNYSRTTSKYRSQFLNENTSETRKKIESGVYQITNLN